MKKVKVDCEESFKILIEPGRYSWCACGYSADQPYCDNAHRTAETELKSIKEVVTETRITTFCGCKLTSTPPFCDGSQAENS
ncbi:MAG: CDGSH iron-sulfur domain-containing protein [Balneolales bacterium]